MDRFWFEAQTIAKESFDISQYPSLQASVHAAYTGKRLKRYG